MTNNIFQKMFMTQVLNLNNVELYKTFFLCSKIMITLKKNVILAGDFNFVYE